MLEYIIIITLAIIFTPIVIDSIIDDYKWIKFKHSRHDDDDDIIGGA